MFKKSPTPSTNGSFADNGTANVLPGRTNVINAAVLDSLVDAIFGDKIVNVLAACGAEGAYYPIPDPDI
ncbi:hypothetical protein DPMN_051371 [Dreissena polymorpha]|uniref:Uncharacterized protein n=1 Tax=Dreissena polymorpha TaxID=45954 RepID=A0A9D4CJ83_DREPO|nr:hypothetical protein DPMN_051371 [Dreissena polymorpha]